MNKRRPARAENLRLALAQEAARVMAEHGIRDFLAAKRKAAERFGVVDSAVLPKNTEIEAALAQYQRLFVATEHAESLLSQRYVALEAMRCLEEYAPRLVGAVLSGTATAHADVQLHLFADTDHFMFAESNTRVRRIVQDWLADYFPVAARAAA